MKLETLISLAAVLGLAALLSACSANDSLPEENVPASVCEKPAGPKQAEVLTNQVQPLAQAEKAKEEAPKRLPVLMFHKVSYGKPDDMTVTPDKFRQVMGALKAAGYESVLPEQWLAYVRQGAALPEKPFVLTFDDGWKSQYEEALPIMEEFGYKGAFFVYPDFVGGKLAMSWEELAELASKGHCIGSHSMSHGRLVNRFGFETMEAYVARLAREARLSKEAIEENIGCPVTVFCYPYGFYSQTLMAVLKRCGYGCAFTVNAQMNGPEEDPFLLGRFQVNEETSCETVLKWLEYPLCEAALMEPRDGQNLPLCPAYGRIKLGKALLKAIEEGAEVKVRCHHDRPAFTLEGDTLAFPIKPHVRHLTIAVTAKTKEGPAYQRSFYVTCDAAPKK